MRATVRAAVMVACTALLGVSAVFAAPTGGTGQGTAGLEQLVQPVQYGGGYCERLRRACVYRACVYKEYRGEVGEGNCRRYRNECGG